MSKLLSLFLPAAFIVALLLTCCPCLFGQQREVRVQIESGAPRLIIETQVKRGRDLSFLRSLGGVNDLGRRFSNLSLSDGVANRPVTFRKLIEGEFLADSDFDEAIYTVNLSVPKRGLANISWLTGDHGILMLADLLPVGQGSPMTVEFESLPESLRTIVTAEKKLGDGPYAVDNPDDAVFYLGNGWRSRKLQRDTTSPSLNISGQWHFSDEEAGDMVAEVIREYQTLFRVGPLSDVQIAIARFPAETRPGSWEAETRGRNVTIISSDMPFKSQSLQRLHEQLRHELFHLWIPNGLNLTGNYDWFYEGFALYQSLKLAVGLNRIRFEDFLDTLSRAHTIDSAYSQRVSLIQASATRFSGANTQVYARGMLVAFVCDLAMLRESRGKRSIEGIVRDVFQKHREPNPSVDGNASVIALLKSNRELIPIVDKYVNGSEKIDWASDLSSAGIADIDSGPITTLRVKEKPSGREKTLLDKLGYNNWRKLSRNSR